MHSDTYVASRPAGHHDGGAAFCPNGEQIRPKSGTIDATNSLEARMNDRQELEARILDLEAAQLSSRCRMRRLTATNIFLAVVVLAFGGAGAAYAVAAANSVNSASIIDGSIITPDLKNGALSGSKILDNAVTGADVNESSLDLADRFAFNATESVVNCVGTDAADTPQTCDTQSIALTRPGTVLVVATGQPVLQGGQGADGDLDLLIDGNVVRRYFVRVREATADARSPFILTAIKALPAGAHNLSLRWTPDSSFPIETAFVDISVDAVQLGP